MHRPLGMKNNRRLAASCCAVSVLALFASTAEAQDEEVTVYQGDEDRVVVVEGGQATPEQRRMSMLFIEATGAYGVQFGRTDYLPAGATADYQHPIVHGFGVGGTVGVSLIPGLAVIANYEYSNARSRHGSLQGVIDDVQGSIDYHTVVAGLRLSVPAGPGFFQAELAGGVVMPFHTELEITYGAALAGLPTPITGTGTMISNYSVGFGGHGMIGYRIPIFGPLYTALNIKLRTFESENAGETNELRNFVTDFEALPPTAITADVPRGDGAARPTTNSVQDVRLQLAIGAEF